MIWSMDIFEGGAVRAMLHPLLLNSLFGCQACRGFDDGPVLFPAAFGRDGVP
jgi:hypothetical protein